MQPGAARERHRAERHRDAGAGMGDEAEALRPPAPRARPRSDWRCCRPERNCRRASTAAPARSSVPSGISCQIASSAITAGTLPIVLESTIIIGAINARRSGSRPLAASQSSASLPRPVAAKRVVDDEQTDEQDQQRPVDRRQHVAAGEAPADAAAPPRPAMRSCRAVERRHEHRQQHERRDGRLDRLPAIVDRRRASRTRRGAVPAPARDARRSAP